MAGQSYAEMVGADEAVAEMKQWAAKLPADLWADNGPVAHWAVDVAKGAVPFDTGALAGSVIARYEGDALAVVGTIVYAGWVEFGGGHGRPYVAEGRYVHPAVTDSQSALQAVIEKETQASIDAWPWSQPSGG